LLSDSNKLLREQKNKLDQLLETTQSRVQELEGEIQPLKESMKALTVQKDALVAEKTALKNEVGILVLYSFAFVIVTMDHVTSYLMPSV